MIKEARPFFFTMLLSALSVNSFAAKLALPENFRALNINGKESTFSFLAISSNVELVEGRNIVELQYRELFEGDEDDTIKVSSSPIIIDLYSQGNTDLKLLAPIFEDEEQARQYAKAPRFEIVDEVNKQILFKVLKNSPESTKEVKQVIVSSELDVTRSVPKVSNPSLSFNENVSSLTLLKFWWEQANAEQQQKFLQYINQQQENRK